MSEPQTEALEKGADSELTGVIDDLRDVLWAILYADQDNHIPDDLYAEARAAIERADRARGRGKELRPPETRPH